MFIAVEVEGISVAKSLNKPKISTQKTLKFSNNLESPSQP
jgi:hypothetical protein